MKFDVDLHIAYALMVLAGLALIVFFRPSSRYSSVDKSSYYRIQAITLIGAIFGAKLAVVMGDALWPIKPFHGWLELLTSGRSIVGALLFGFLFAELFKPIIGYKLPPNDRFAIVLPFSIATGRMGCWLSGCCLGIPMEGGIALTGIDGVSRFPAPLVELAFHLIAGGILVTLWRGKLLHGRFFAIYIMAYGLFRMTTEHWRVTEKAFYGYSAYQWFALALVVAGAASLYFRSRRNEFDANSAVVHS